MLARWHPFDLLDRHSRGRCPLQYPFSLQIIENCSCSCCSIRAVSNEKKSTGANLPVPNPETTAGAHLQQLSAERGLAAVAVSWASISAEGGERRVAANRDGRRSRRRRMCRQIPFVRRYRRLQLRDRVDPNFGQQSFCFLVCVFARGRQHVVHIS